MQMAFALNEIFFYLLLLLPISAIAQTSGNMTVGSSLYANNENSSWLSPSGDFAFGFRHLTNTDFFVLSIWYDKIADKTIIWSANGDNPAPRESKMEITANRGLLLTSPQGVVLWISQSLTGVASFGSMYDTGNFVLEDNNFNKVWESFLNPTETILPTQKMEREGVLSSRQSENNFSEGRFQLRFIEGGSKLVLNSINFPTIEPIDAYYEKKSTVSDSDTSSPGKQLVFDESGYIYILTENEERINLSRGEVSTENSYVRATLNFDGIFTLYSHPKTTSMGNEIWTSVWSVPDNICKDFQSRSGTGACGYNTICSLKADKRPKCECLRGYSFLDPNDPYGSCKPDFAQECTEDEHSSEKELYAIEEIPNTDWPGSDYISLRPFTEENCKNSCLQDCMCTVAVFAYGDGCWKKKSPLSNGRFDSNFGGKAFIKVRKDNSTLRGPCNPISGKEPIQNKKKEKILILVGSVLLGCSVFVNFSLICCVLYGCFFIYQKKIKITNEKGSVLERNLHCFTYKYLQDATDGFKEQLGKGSFGVVYKGSINMGSNVLVAVKKLNSVAQEREEEFQAEVNIIAKTCHKNLVRLLGFCNEGPQRLLVYEFLSNGSLAGFLFGDSKPNWKERIQIAVGIARGLLYLHEECCCQIIHCDIKPQNILLDEYYNARISDFGLAKLLRMDQSHTNTAIRGTKGYVAPEWFKNTPITSKVDVYSFGVVLLEIICCRKNVLAMESGREHDAILIDWAYDCFRDGEIDALVEFDVEAIDDMGNVERFVMVAIWCIQEDQSLRPTMRKVTQMLDGVVDVPIPPCPSAFTTTART